MRIEMMTRHPDNPTNLEAAGEEFSDAVRLAKSSQPECSLAPWLEPIPTEEGIRQACARIADLLIAELHRYDYDEEN